MKLHFDANLSRRIVPMLADLFPGSSHISGVGLGGETPDEVIWEFAKENAFAIVTGDADFLRLADQRGTAPKIIRLERMDYPPPHPSSTSFGITATSCGTTGSRTAITSNSSRSCCSSNDA